jgi:uncharacterized membrane protein
MVMLRGTPGHPNHPPLTDVTIGAYTTGTILGVLAAIGVTEHVLTKAWWLAILVGLGAAIPTAITGLAEWKTITRDTPMWRTATTHLVTMVVANIVYLGVVLTGHHCYISGDMGVFPLVLTIIGFIVLAVGGRLGGTIVYVHGKRVLKTGE